MTGLKLEGLGIRHDGQTIVADISLAVAEGESLCLIGASGSGKSLIAAAIAGLLPDCMTATGYVTLGAHRVAAANQAALRALWHYASCLLPQEPAAALAPLLSALGQVRLSAPRLGRGAGLGWLARFGLDHRAARRFPFELSGGMAQRLVAALAMRTAARVLVADEPTKALDPARADELLALLAALRDSGRALLVITHDLGVPRVLGGQLAVLDGGRLVECDTVDAVLAAPRSAFARACLAAEPRHWPIRQKPGPPGADIASAERLVIARLGRRLAGPLDLTLRTGTLTALLGRSGVGKTTLGDTVLGLCPPDAGRITWLGRTLDRRRRRELRPQFQKLHQDPTTVFATQRTLGESLGDLARISSDARRALPVLLERLRVSSDLLSRRPGEVSGGEAQRIALARTLALRPVLLVADEPCSRLDPPTQAEALHLLRELVDDDGLAVLLITHDHTAADALADVKIDLAPTALISD